MVFLRKFLYGICLSRTHRRYKNAKNRSLDRFVYSDIPGIGRFLRWWTRSMPLFLGGTDDRRSRLKLRKLELAIRNYGTFENFIAKSLAGFTFGVILTYGLYFLFVFPLNFSFAGATLWCVIIGFISTLGLAFSEYFRSIALLSLPSFFSGKGRQALTTYAVILAVTGPGKNSLTNVRVLSDSIGCSQERVRKSLRDVFQLTKNPYAAIKQSLSVVIARIMEIAKKIEAITSTIKKSVLSMDQVLIAASESMSKVAAICQSKGKHPYTTCIRALKKNYDDCRVSLKCIFGGLCKSDDLPNSMCNRFRKVESVCSLPSDPSNEISKRVHMKLSAFFRRLHNLMTFKLTKSHELHYELRKNREVDVVNAIATDIRELTASILYLFDSISVLFSFFYFYLFYSVITFRNKYLAHEWYENRYITSNLLLIEMRRMRQKKATIFPLSRIESQKYIKINSLNLGTMDVYEMYNMIIRSVALFIKISLHMAADYGLWWLIMECRRAANHIQVPEGMSNVKVQTCRADGLSGEIYNEIANAFQPNRFNFTTDMTSCLPEPSAPDIKRNITIMLIGVLTVIIGFVEPYGKRLKVSIMNFYYPIIARRRSVWLYNHIIRTRNSFTRVARRRLRREYGRWDRKDSETAAFMYRFRCDIGSKMPFATLRRMVTPMDKKYNRCILCKTYGAPDDPLTSCVTPGCKGTYCLECFANLQNICTICLTPLQYNDVSDMSEEKDSSDDEGRTSVKKCLDKALSDKPMGAYSSESEASTVGSHDFDPEVDGVRPNVNVEQYDLEDFPFAPQAFTCHDKEKDWATMQDFELPKGEATQYAIAEQGIAMTLSHRIRTGFSGLIFAKPVFGRAAETENMYDSTDHTIKTGNVSDTECLSRGSAIRRTLGCVPKKLLTFAKRRMLRSLNVRGKHEFCRTSPSRSGSGASSRRSLPGHISKLSINPPENHDNFRFLERGSKRSDRLLQVYYGLHMSNSEYQRVKSCSGSEIEEQSEGSSVLEVITTKSVTWSTDRRHSQNESSRLGDTMTSRVYDSSSTSSQCAWSKREAATTDTIPTVTRQEPHTEGVQTRLEEMPAPVVQGRLSFRNIKAQPTKSQVTHKMFHVDESE